MRRLSTITFMGVMALAMAGCSSNSQDTTAIPSTPQPSAKAFDKALIANQPLASPISSAPILIQPTNGNQRAKQVEKGRRDPFAGLFAQAGLSVPIEGTNSGITNSGVTNSGVTNSGSSQSPGLSIPGSRRQQPRVAARGSARPRVGGQSSGNPSRQQPNPDTNNPGSQSSPAQTNPTQTPPLPPVEPATGFETVSPPPPQQPELATNVAVSGVIQIGNEAQAIVQVPNEGTSRYVRVGQRLSNGQVLVKRIEMNEGSDPVVILEQYGIEVARSIGDKPANGSQTTTSTDGSQPQGEGQVSQPSSQGTQSPTQIVTPTDGGAGSQPVNDGSVAPLDAGGSSQQNDGFVAPQNDGSVAPLDAGGSSPQNDGSVAPLDAGGSSPQNDGSVAPLDAGGSSPQNDGAVPTNTIPVPQPPNVSPGSGVQ